MASHLPSHPSYPPMTVPPTHANSCRHDRRNSRFCLQLRDSSTHGLRQHTDIRDPQAALVCAATHCLASPLFNTISPPHRHAIPTLLCYTDAPRSPVFHAFSYRPVPHFRVLASALRAHALGTLECALWASAIGHSSLSSPAGTDPALCALLTDAARWGWRENTEIDLNMVEPEAGRELRSRAIATEETGTPRDGVVEGVATAIAFAFARICLCQRPYPWHRRLLYRPSRARPYPPRGRSRSHRSQGR